VQRHDPGWDRRLGTGKSVAGVGTVANGVLAGAFADLLDRRRVDLEIQLLLVRHARLAEPPSSVDRDAVERQAVERQGGA